MFPSSAAPAKFSVGRRGAKKKKENEEEEEEKVEELIFSLEAHSSKELRHFKFLSVSFMAQLLGSASFIGKVKYFQKETKETQTLDLIFRSTCLHVIRL